jgi:WD40 repeat protein
MFASTRGLVFLALTLPTGTTTSGQEPKTDQFGDPLPHGAIARFGTVRLRSHHDIDNVALSHDGKLLVTWDNHSPLQVWDGITGQLRREIPLLVFKSEEFDRWQEEVAAVSFAADSAKLYVLTRNGYLRACNLADGKWSEPLARTRGPVAKEYQLIFSSGLTSHDGTHFLYLPRIEQPGVLPDPDRVEVFAVGKDKPILELTPEKLKNYGPGCRFAFTSDNKLLAVWQVGHDQVRPGCGEQPRRYDTDRSGPTDPQLRNVHRREIVRCHVLPE